MQNSYQASGISGKLQLEQLTTPAIYFHKEGDGWRAYEYSAYRYIHEIDNSIALILTSDIPPGKEVICITLSTPDMDKVLKNRPHAHISSELVAIASNMDLHESEFESWHRTQVVLAIHI